MYLNINYLFSNDGQDQSKNIFYNELYYLTFIII